MSSVSEELHFLSFCAIDLCEFQLPVLSDVCLYVLGKKGWENTANKEVN